MTPSRPYLIRALYDWIVDNGLTPYLLVDSGVEGVEAPLEYADNGKLVLNVAPGAVNSLRLDNDAIRFAARFGGVAREVALPVRAVLAIYARENGQGMLFSDTDDGEPPPAGPDGDGDGGPKSRPRLRVVK